MKSLLYILLLSTSAAFSQNEKLSLNMHFGAGLSNAISSLNYKPKQSFNAGIEIRQSLGQKGLHFQTGIRWNEFAWKRYIEFFIWNEQSQAYNQTSENREETTFYVSVPAILTYKFKNKLKGLTFSTGPQLSLYVLRKRIIDGEIDLFESVPVNPPTLSFSAYASVGYEYCIGENWMIGGEAYYNFITPYAGNLKYNLGLGIRGAYILKHHE